MSIVVPIYNSSKTLSQCLDSLIGQSLSDIEIICVDDCSADNSIDIIETYVRKDERVRLIRHENNKGTLKTRFDGVMASTGSYIMFLDADDYYSKDACKITSSKIMETESDMLQFGTAIVYDELDEEVLNWFTNFLKPCAGPLYGDEIFVKQFDGMCWHVWNRIYDSKLCKKSFVEAGENYHIYSDDLYVSFFLSYYSKHFESIEDKCYYYNIDKSSVRSKDNKHELIVTCENSHYIYECIDFLKKENKNDLIESVCYRYPLLELEHSFNAWARITDNSDKLECVKILKTTWSDGIFNDIYEAFSTKYRCSEELICQDCINNLEKRNNELEKRNNELENRNSELEAKLIELEDNTIPAMKNVFRSFIKKIK